MKLSEETLINYTIARKILGRPLGGMYEDDPDTYIIYDQATMDLRPMPNWSTSLEAAWELLEELNLLWCQVGRENCSGVRYDCHLYNDPEMSDKVNATAPTPALAICKAILKYKGIDYEDKET